MSEKTLLVAFGLRVRAERVRQGLRQQEVASLLPALSDLTAMAEVVIGNETFLLPAVEAEALRVRLCEREKQSGSEKMA